MMASKRSNSTICGACHDLVTPANVHLERSFAEWKTTIFALNDPDPTAFLPQTCSSCDMFPTDGIIADRPDLNVPSRENGFHEHMWPAVDLALTPFPQMAEQEAAVKRDLLPAIAIKGIKPGGTTEAPGGICLNPDLTLTIRIDSFSVGHMFPSGAAQDRRVWLQVEVFDAAGNILFERGTVPDGVDPEQTTDPTLTTDCTAELPSCGTFFDRTFKSDGTPAHFFWEVASYKSRLIRPPVTRDRNSAAYDHSTTVKYRLRQVRAGGEDGSLTRANTLRCLFREQHHGVLGEAKATRDARIGHARDRRVLAGHRPHLGDRRAGAQECRHGRVTARAVTAHRLDAQLERELANRRLVAAGDPERAALDDARRQHPRFLCHRAGGLERRRDRRDARTDLVRVARLLVPRVDRHEVTGARAGKPQSIDDRCVSLADLLDDVRDAFRAGDPEQHHVVAEASHVIGRARGRGHIAEGDPQGRKRSVAMDVRVSESALHAARPRERDECSLGLGVTVHGGSRKL